MIFDSTVPAEKEADNMDQTLGFFLSQRNPGRRFLWSGGKRRQNHSFQLEKI